MFPFSAQTGDFNGEFILINRMVDLQNPREHRHPPRERSPVHMTWRNSPPCEPNCGALLFLIHFSLFQNTAAFFLFGFSGFAVLGKWRNGYRARVPTVAEPQGESESEAMV